MPLWAVTLIALAVAIPVSFAIMSAVPGVAGAVLSFWVCYLIGTIATIALH